MNYAGIGLFCVLASQAAFAQQHLGTSLDRPDPGVGAGFASAMAGQFKTAFGVSDAEANCLVYEVMTELRATRQYDSTPVEIARKISSRCGLALRGSR